jgi:alpha-L-rhamnosidase
METIAGRVTAQTSEWTGKWCWTGHVSRPWNQYVYFRKSVELPTAPTKAIVRVSADALYTLYVNGQRVHQGPARCYPTWQSYDVLDLTGLLKPGTNVIAAIAYQFGVPTFQRVFRDANGFILDGVIETAGEPLPIHTPDGWQCRAALGWRKTVARQAIQLGFQEHFDADADPPDWLDEKFLPTTEGGWKTPWSPGPVGSHPWLLMEPRDVPLLADHVESFTGVVGQFKGENPRGYKVVDDIYRLVDPAALKKATGLVENPEALLADSDAVTTIAPPPDGQFVAITLDTGIYRTGHLILEIDDAAGDECIDVIFAEELESTQIPLIIAGTSSEEAQALRYRCRPGKQKWEAFQFMGMRYVLVVFRNVEEKPLQIRRIAIRQVHTAFDNSGSFQSSDEKLNQIWDVGKRTQLNCSFDTFVDCPWREQAMWWGDARVQGRVTAVAFGDTTLLERGIRLVLRSQTPDGAMHAHPPADIPRHRLPDFMLTWVGTLWDHYQYTGRTDLLRECRAAMHRVFEFFTAHESPDGLIGSFSGYWMFLDWQQIFKGNYSAPFNLMYLQALRWAADICRLTDDPAAAGYDERAARLTVSIEKFFWDPKAKGWRDGFDAATGKPVEQVSQHTATLAILLGLKPETHEALAKNVLLKSAKSTRTKILTASPFFYAYVLEAMVACGLAAEAVAVIKDKWGKLIDEGATTFPEMWAVKAESRCHAWSSSPVYHLSEIVLGIRSMSPGWGRVKISPLISAVENARGTVSTPHGLIRLEWEKVDEDQLAVRVDLPDGIAAEFVSPDGSARKLEAGANQFHT